MIKLFLTLSLIFLSLFLPYKGFVQVNDYLLNDIKKSGNIFNQQESADMQNKIINERVGNIIEYFLSFAGVIFLILMIIASFIWITAQGDKEKISSAKKLLTSGVVGAFISFGSFIAVNTLLMPLSNRYFTPVSLNSGGSGIVLSEIHCETNMQCADQPTRKICQDNNCVECLENDEGTDGSNWSSACVQIYNYEKPICDIVNNVCTSDPTEDCSKLSLNSCLTREDCRWQYKFDDTTTLQGFIALVHDILDPVGLGMLYTPNNMGKPDGGKCQKKEEYVCEEQCGPEKPFCNKDFNPPFCVECRNDDDCKTRTMFESVCSTSTANFKCVPF